MLTLSKALSANQARTYHAREFMSEKQNYWSRDRQGHSEWQGELAREWGLHGSVADEQFTRLRQADHERRTSRRMGCNVLRTKVCVGNSSCWW
jgi:hypothetical protein